MDSRLKQLGQVKDMAPRSRGTSCPRSAIARPSQTCRGRRECRVKASPMARLRKKCRRQVPQAKPVQPAFPARRSSRLYAVSLVRRACWPPSPRGTSAPSRLDTSVGVSGRCDFTSAAKPFVGVPEDTLRQHRGHRIPTSRVVTIARNAPPSEAGCAEIIMISDKTQEDYFFQNLLQRPRRPATTFRTRWSARPEPHSDR